MLDQIVPVECLRLQRAVIAFIKEARYHHLRAQQCKELGCYATYAHHTLAAKDCANRERIASAKLEELEEIIYEKE